MNTLLKKILSLVLLGTMAVGLCSCTGKPIIYDEEIAVQQWLTRHTEGYALLQASSRMVLYRDEEGFTVKIDTGTDLIPRITVADEKTNTTAVDNSFLIVTEDASLYAQASHANSVFDPYRNSYTRALKVYKKDDTTFRVFFWLYGSATDFYPIPQLLTSDQYTQMLEKVDAYTWEHYDESMEEQGEAINYTGDFMALYKGQYFSDKATNPNGEIFYQYTGTASEYLSVYEDLFAELGLTQQDWRKSYETLGYTGQRLDLQILYCDINVGTDAVHFTLNTSDAYTSNLLAYRNPKFTYAFCSGMIGKSFVRVEQN